MAYKTRTNNSAISNTNNSKFAFDSNMTVYTEFFFILVTATEAYQSAHVRSWTEWYNTDNPRESDGDDERTDSIRKVRHTRHLTRTNIRICAFSVE